MPGAGVPSGDRGGSRHPVGKVVVMTTLRPMAEYDLRERSSYQAPPLEADLIMKGGITSGLVYPLVASRLATRYRFRSVGGASAGAIAAGFTAAAEYQRQHPRPGATGPGDAGDGFVALTRIPDVLGTTLSSLFVPASAVKRAYQALTAWIEPDWGPGRKIWRSLTLVVAGAPLVFLVVTFAALRAGAAGRAGAARLAVHGGRLDQGARFAAGLAPGGVDARADRGRRAAAADHHEETARQRVRLLQRTGGPGILRGGQRVHPAEPAADRMAHPLARRGGRARTGAGTTDLRPPVRRGGVRCVPGAEAGRGRGPGLTAGAAGLRSRHRPADDDHLPVVPASLRVPLPDQDLPLLPRMLAAVLPGARAGRPERGVGAALGQDPEGGAASASRSTRPVPTIRGRRCACSPRHRTFPWSSGCG